MTLDRLVYPRIVHENLSKEGDVKIMQVPILSSFKGFFSISIITSSIHPAVVLLVGWYRRKIKNTVTNNKYQ
jgi:hypothetical protein